MTGTSTSASTAVPRRPKPLVSAPVVDANPDSATVQAAMGGAKVERVIVGSGVTVDAETPATVEVAMAPPVQVAPSRPIRTEVPPPPERWLPKFSLVEAHADLLDEIAERFRRASGQECSMSRIVAAGIVALAGMSESDLVHAVSKVPMRKSGRRSRGGRS